MMKVEKTLLCNFVWRIALAHSKVLYLMAEKYDVSFYWPLSKGRRPRTCVNVELKVVT